MRSPEVPTIYPGTKRDKVTCKALGILHLCIWDSSKKDWVVTSPAKKLLLTKMLTDLQKQPMSSALYEHVDTPVAEAPTVDQDHRQESPRYHRTHSFCSKIPRTPVFRFIVGKYDIWKAESPACIEVKLFGEAESKSQEFSALNEGYRDS